MMLLESRAYVGGSQHSIKNLERYCSSRSISFLASLLLTSVLAIGMWPMVAHDGLLAWVSTIWLVQGGHWLFAQRFLKSRRSGIDIYRRWMLGFLLGAALTGACWSASFFFMGLSHADPHAFLLIFAIAGVTAYAGLTMAIVLPVAIVFELAVVLPMVVWLFAQGTRVHDFMGVASLLYLAMLYMVLRQTHAMSEQVGNLKYQNEAREREFRTLAENFPDVVIRYDLEGRRTYVNRALAELAGSEPDQMLGKFLEDTPLVDPDAYVAELRRVIATHEAALLEVAACEPGGEIFWYLARFVPEFDAESRVSGVLMVAGDITERRRMEQELQRREADFRALAENLPVAVIRYDAEQRRRYINPAAERMLHGSMEELLGKVPGDGGVPATQAMIEHYRGKMSEVLAACETCELEFVLDALPLDRQEYFEVSFSPESDEDGNILGVLAIWFDITERKQAQQRLELLEHAMAVSADAIYLIEDDLRFSYVNDAACRTLGYTREELLAIGPHDIDPSISREIAQQVLETSPVGVPVSFETQHRTRDGRIFPVELHGTHFERNGRKFGLSVVRDITERKRMETELAVREQQFRTLLENTPDVIVRYDRDCRRVYVNPAWEKVNGISCDAVIGKSPQEISVRVKPVALDFERMLRGVIERGVSDEMDLVWQAEDGKQVCFALSAIPEFEEDGAVVSVLTIARDISERKQVEAQLERERATLRTFFCAMPNLAWMKDSEGRYLACNPVFEQLYGQAEEAILGKTDFDYVDAELAAFFRQKDKEAEIAGKPCVNEEWVTFASDGRRALIETVKAPVFDAEGRVVGIIGVAHDITERKQAEAALRRSEQLMRTVVDATPDWIFIKDQEHRYRLVNQGYADALHLAPEDFIGKTDLDLGFPEELVKGNPEKGIRGFWADDRLVLDSNETHVFTDDPATIDGEVHTFHSIKVPLRRGDGKPWGVLAFARDISERKHYELALRESEEQARSHSNLLNAIVESSPDVIVFALDTQYRYLSFNRKHKETMQAIWGKEIAAGMNMLDVIGSHSDREKAKQGFDRALSGESFVLEEAYGDELLSRQYWQNYWAPIRAATGEVVGLTCFVMNVTERRRIEDAMRANEEKLSTLFTLSPLGIALTDMQGSYVEFNEAFRAICGYPADELMALDYWTLTPREYEAQEAEQLASLERTGRYGPYEKAYRQKDGTLIPIRLNGMLVSGQDGKSYIWSIVEDITERKRTEALLKEKFGRIVELNNYLEENARILEEQTVELEASQEQLKESLEFTEGIINAIPDVLFEVDGAGRYHNIWTHSPELLAAQKSQLLGNTIDQMMPPDAAGISMAAIREAEELGGSFGKIIRLVLPQGERWFELSVARKSGGSPVDPHFVVLSRDVTERHAMEVAREAALAEAQRLVQMRSAFMAQMSHELRTPLNGILGYAQNLLQGDGLGEKQTSGLNIIRHSGEHLLSLINGLLDHAAIEAGKFELVPDDFELQPFLGGIIGIIRVRAEQKNLAFTCEAAADLPAVVRGDAQRLRQVLINLLANAVKFTDSGAVTLRVSYLAPSRIRFEVQDSGVGIAADQLENIFLPFEQTGEIQRRAGGSGLGLAISRTLVRLMGGDIRVESRSGAGSTFSFEIEIGAVQSDRGGFDAAALSVQAETRVAQAAPLLAAPPRQELDTLHGFALRGSMRDVVRHADRLAEADARYQPFAAQLRQLAQSFQTRALLGLIEQYRDRAQEV